MGYRNLRECINDLDRHGQLVRLSEEIDPHLEAAEIHRRVYQAGGPAVLYENVKGCRFPMVSNLFGTLDRARFLFRDTLDFVRRLVEYKIDPLSALRLPLKAMRALPTAWAMQPKYVSSGPATCHVTKVSELPQLQCWPDDGGAFITLPAVYTEHPDSPGWQRSNLGMYRVQFSGGEYQPDAEVGLHYQIHRGIGVHHAAAVKRGEPLNVNVHVGGPPAIMLSAVMPLPEGLSELTFAGALGGRRVRMIRNPAGLPIIAESDFCLTGTIDPQRTLPEGPFGDHLGYYSLTHDFPVMRIEKVYHREGAIWPFTVVGRPPQEDTAFGELIHDITGPAIPSVLPGVKAVHAVDAAGVHPLLLAIGSERYVPYEQRRKPRELMTQANAILGQGQLSLAKYLWIAAEQDDASLDIHNIEAFFRHILQRVDWEHDLHFQTRTTIDTLDYSGHGLNEGSKVVITAAGPARRELPTTLPGDMRLPAGFDDPRLCFPGVLAIRAPKWSGYQEGVEPALGTFCDAFDAGSSINTFPLIVLIDDAAFTTESLRNWLWVTFTRSNPAADIAGIGSFVHQKHWGCRGSLVIDARLKSHHAPPLMEDSAVSRRVDRLFAQGGPLANWA